MKKELSEMEYFSGYCSEHFEGHGLGFGSSCGLIDNKGYDHGIYCGDEGDSCGYGDGYGHGKGYQNETGFG